MALTGHHCRVAFHTENNRKTGEESPTRPAPHAPRSRPGRAGFIAPVSPQCVWLSQDRKLKTQGGGLPLDGSGGPERSQVWSCFYVTLRRCAEHPGALPRGLARTHTVFLPPPLYVCPWGGRVSGRV